MRRSTAQWFAILSVLALSQLAAAQATINVPADQSTIQGAINAANNGDTVLVAPGTYNENISFNGKAITVTSSNGAAQTIIDGGSLAPVVSFTAGETPSSVLNGFTLQNGASTFNTQYAAGGIYINSSSPTITSNTIQNNKACGEGGGIAVLGGSPLIQGNTIQNNTQGPCSGGSGGGGIALLGASGTRILGNVIVNNTWRSGNGGGISMNGAGNVVIQNNIIAGNTATGVSPAALGGGISMVNDSDPMILQNLIYNNNADLGSGVSISVPSGVRGPILLNNTILGGIGRNQGSAIYATGYDNQVQLSNNLLVGASGDNAVYCDATYQSQPPIFASNDAYAPNAIGFGGSCASSLGQNGNISSDPLFVNTAALDFHLQPSSPAIDAGTNSAPNLPKTDYDGKPRIVDGNNDCISTVDIGAYEFQAAAKVSFSPSSLTFSDQPVGTSSAPQQVTLSNTGNACFQFSSTQITGDFSQNDNCPSSMLGGTSCTYSVFFSPTTTGSRTGALSVSGSDGITTSGASVSLSGNGIIPQPAASLSPSILAFGSQILGTTSNPQNVTVTNTGNAALNISAITVTGAFLQNNNCPVSMLPNTSCTVSVYFSPASVGAQSGVVSVTDNAPGSPHTVTVSGTGIDFAVAVSPNSGTIKHGQAGNFNVSVSALGGAFNSTVTLSCSGVPRGATCGLSPANVIPGAGGATSTMTISTSGNTPRGNYSIVVTGTSGSDVHSATLLLTVN